MQLQSSRCLATFTADLLLRRDVLARRWRDTAPSTLCTLHSTLYTLYGVCSRARPRQRLCTSIDVRAAHALILCVRQRMQLYAKTYSLFVRVHAQPLSKANQEKRRSQYFILRNWSILLTIDKIWEILNNILMNIGLNIISFRVSLLFLSTHCPLIII